MNTQVIADTEAYIITDLQTNESWLLARVELCNGTFLIIRGLETRLYRTRHRFDQAWLDMMQTIKVMRWSKELA